MAGRSKFAIVIHQANRFNPSIVVGHYIDDQVKAWPLINYKAIWSILAPSASFLLEYVSGFVLRVVFAHLLGKFLRKEGSFAFRFAFSLFSQADSFFKRRSAVGLLFVSNLLFLWIVKGILSNNVKTGKLLIEILLLTTYKVEFF